MEPMAAMGDRMTEAMEQKKTEFFRSLLKIIQDWEEVNHVWITSVRYDKTSGTQQTQATLSLKLPRGA